MPAGTIQSAHFLQTPHYTQITGTGDLTKINILAGDEGGELDPHGATGKGNPVGGTVYSNGVKVAEWTMFVSANEYCFRACPQNADDSWLWCQHIYDVMGCQWNEPGDYGSGFDTCDGDSTNYPPGIYNVNGQQSTFHQGDGNTPAAHQPGASSNCQYVQTVGNGIAAPTQSSNNAGSTPASSSAYPSNPKTTSSSKASSTYSSSSRASSTRSSSMTTSSARTSSASTSLSTSTALSSSTVTSTSIASTVVAAAAATSAPPAATVSIARGSNNASNGASKLAGAGSALAALAAVVVYFA